MAQLYNHCTSSPRNHGSNTSYSISDKPEDSTEALIQKKQKKNSLCGLFDLFFFALISIFDTFLN